MSALLITLGIYAIPVFFTGLAWYAQASTSSIVYILLIKRFSHSRERFPLIVIEIINLLLILFCFVSQYLIPNQNFVRANIADIMTAVFLIELLISLGAMIGISWRNTAIRDASVDSNKSDHRIGLLGGSYSSAGFPKKKWYHSRKSGAVKTNLQTEVYP